MPEQHSLPHFSPFDPLADRGDLGFGGGMVLSPFEKRRSKQRRQRSRRKGSKTNKTSVVSKEEELFVSSSDGEEEKAAPEPAGPPVLFPGGLIRPTSTAAETR
jgi:hypothetical protein